MNRKGYVYTVISMMLALVLLSVVSLYYESYKSSTDISPAKLRTDELHYFVESSKKDTGRAMYISARRGAAYLDDYVINNHTTLADATLALKQVMVNGTLTEGATTFNVSYMQGQTLNTFLSSLQTSGSELRFRTNVSLRAIDVYMYDSLHLMVVAKYNYSIVDLDTAEGGVCGYENENQTLYVLVPVDGLEDPLYSYSTTNKASRTYNRSTWGGIRTLAYASRGGGISGGQIYDLSGEGNGQDDDIIDYNDSTPGLVPYTLFVINTTSLPWSSFDLDAKIILNQSGGVIDYHDGLLESASFPYVAGLTEKVNFSDTDYAIIRNGGQHQILYPGITNDIKNRLYSNSTNASCFLDRLEGRANLTQKYRNLAAEARSLLGQPNTAPIGIESYVNVSDLNSSGMYADITGRENISSVDYLYFQDIPGKWVYGTPYWFRMDAYNLKTKNLTDYCYDNYAGVWHFDESYDAGDTYTYEGSRNASALKLSDSFSSISPEGKNGNGLLLEGNSGLAEADVNVSETSYTIGLWFKAEAGCVDCGIFGTDDGTEDHNDRDIYFDPLMTGYICAYLYGSPSEEICTDGPETYNDGGWHYVVHVYDNDSSIPQKIYVDGLEQAEGTLTYSNRTEQTRIRIGVSERANSDYFVGMIDDVKIWNRALEDWEIMEEYEKLR